MISLRSHNIGDYVIGVALILTPFLFEFAQIERARNVFLILGFGLICYSLITRYYYSAVKILPLGIHMALDVISGMFLLVAPWVLNYDHLLEPFQHGLHWIFGLGAVGLVISTRVRTEREARLHAPAAA